MIELPVIKSDQAEQQIISACLNDIKCIDEASSIIEAQDFVNSLWSMAFSHLIATRNAGSTPDLVEIADKLKIDVTAIYDAKFAHTFSIFLNDNCNLVKEKARLRSIVDLCKDTIVRAQTEKPEDIYMHLSEKLMSECTKTNGISAVPISKLVDETLEHLENVRKSGGFCGMPTGLDWLDKTMTGFHPGELIIIAARPGVGKSACVVQIVRECAKKGKKIAALSLEMTGKDIMQRILSAESRVPLYVIRDGLKQENYRNTVYATARQIKTWGSWFVDVPKMTANEFRIQARRLVGQGAEMIVVDYLQLLSGNGEGNRVQEMTTISRAFKSAAMELNIPIVALAQLNRASMKDGEEPELHHLRESGSIEQDADAVILLHRKKASDDCFTRSEFPTLFSIAKQRQGEMKKREFIFEGKYQTFKESGSAK